MSKLNTNIKIKAKMQAKENIPYTISDAKASSESGTRSKQMQDKKVNKTKNVVSFYFLL